ncbi:hypothetical protein QTJ16_003867 [Diplocarpon rosae]|uniref:Endosomal spry domain-containing protein n=1 Tax=Diplocarpon rosae TaxID=946125 RepID=A0AAD9T111_9HELO|nr:hypothetical protein QTJ16_003867 [Diplocarpon rosae]
MAPLPESSRIRSYLSSLFSRAPSPTPTPLATALHHLLRRSVEDTRKGVTRPNDIPNKVVFIFLGLIGAGFVITGIWFFFWAKNGGFYFKEDDWEEYKSTVLRRKGPNGTTLSGATESTDLGGGSVVHGEKRWGRRKKRGSARYKDLDEEGSQVTSSLGGSTLARSDMGETADPARKDKKDKKRAKRSKGQRDAAARSDAGTGDEMDVGVADAVRAYRHEKPARVGGINRQPDGSSWDGSNTHDGSTAASDLLSHREKTPTTTPTKSQPERAEPPLAGGGIRQVAPSTRVSTGSFWSRSRGSADGTSERIKAEAEKLQEKGRAAQRREFSFHAGDDSTVASPPARDRQARREERERRRASRSPTKRVPGGFIEEERMLGSDLGSRSDLSSDVGTKIYPHPLPGLSVAGNEYVEERRKKRHGGYRRGRSDSLDE